MLETLWAALSANPVLAGGIGTLAFGSVMYVLRALPGAAFALLTKAVTTRLIVDSLSNEYGDVDAFIEAHRLSFYARSLEMKDGRLKTGYGSGWGFYGRALFHYTKVRAPQQLNPLETITLTFLSREAGLAARFMEACRPEEHKNSIHVSIFGATGSEGGLRRRKRGLETVFVDPHIKERLVSRLRWFLGAQEWHAERGIPWKIGIVLHGPPGTGKTSLIHALASDFGFDVKFIKSLHGLGAAFKSGDHNDLFVIEDIDTLAGDLNREKTSGTVAQGALRGTPLHEILNAMDGILTPDGLKFIVTTNYLDRLDPALVRPGRIDEVLEIGPLPVESARQMFRVFYGREGIGDYQPRTGAELQQLFSTRDAAQAEQELAAPPRRAARNTGKADKAEFNSD